MICHLDPNEQNLNFDEVILCSLLQGIYPVCLLSLFNFEQLFTNQLRFTFLDNSFMEWGGGGSVGGGVQNSSPTFKFVNKT